jgi:hypothetical protein
MKPLVSLAVALAVAVPALGSGAQQAVASPALPPDLGRIDRHMTTPVSMGGLGAIRVAEGDIWDVRDVSAGDLDADGLEDLYTLEFGDGIDDVVARSGRTGAELHRVPWPDATLAVPRHAPRLDGGIVIWLGWLMVVEVTGDAAEDLLFAGFDGDTAGAETHLERRVMRITVVDGATGQLRWDRSFEGSHLHVEGEPSVDRYASMPWMLDIDGDGARTTVLVETIDALVTTSDGVGEAHPFSRATLHGIDAASGATDPLGLDFDASPPEILFAGDVDLDEALDLVSVTRQGAEFKVELLDPSGEVRWTARTVGHEDWFAYRVPLDGQASDILLVVRDTAGAAFTALDGATGASLWSTTAGSSYGIAFVGDLDGQGGADLVELTGGDAIHARFRSGADLGVIADRSYVAGDPEGDAGVGRMYFPGDLDGDGRRDWVFWRGAGDPSFCNLSSETPRTLVGVSSATLEPLWVEDTIGCAGGIESVGADVDGTPGTDVYSFDRDASQIVVRSGRDLSSIVTFPVEARYAEARGADLTADAMPEFIVAGDSEPPAIAAYRTDGSMLWEIDY